MGVLIGLVAVLIVVAVVLAVLRPWDRSTEITAPPPSPTISAGDDGEPTPTPTPSGSPTPTGTPSPTDDSTPVGSVPCPEVADQRQAYPADGRVHGGGMSFAAVPGWDAPYDGGLEWADDDGAQRTMVNNGWFNFAAVGALRSEDGFTAPQAAARAASSCMVTSSGWYPDPTKIEVVRSQPVTVSGRPGYVVSTDVYEPPDVTDDPAILGDRVTVVVVDAGTPGRLAIFVSTASLGRQEILDATAAAMTSLRVG